MILMFLFQCLSLKMLADMKPNLLICWSVNVVFGLWSCFRVGNPKTLQLFFFLSVSFCSICEHCTLCVGGCSLCLSLNNFILHSDEICLWKINLHIYMLFTDFYKHMCMSACTQTLHLHLCCCSLFNISWVKCLCCSS